MDERTAHRNRLSSEDESRIVSGLETVWNELDDVEKVIVTCINENGKASRLELEMYTYKSKGTVINRLNKLIDKGIIKVNGDIHDPTRTYEFV